MEPKILIDDFHVPTDPEEIDTMTIIQTIKLHIR